MNVIAGEWYKLAPKESKGVLKGEYGKVRGTIDEEIRRKCLSPAELESIITCRPADLIEPEFEEYKAEYAGLCRSDEDVLSCALFPQVAPKFLQQRNSQVGSRPSAAPLVSHVPDPLLPTACASS